MTTTSVPYDATDGFYRNAPTSAPAAPGGPGPVPPGGFTTQGVLIVDGDKLAQAVTAFHAVATATQAATNQAAEGTQGGSLGNAPWGSDSLGASFGAEYVPVAQTLNSALDGIVEVFTGIASQLAATQSAFAATEDNNFRLASSLPAAG